MAKKTKLPAILFRLSLTHYDNITWVRFIKSILDECGKSQVWTDQRFPNISWLCGSIKQTLTDQFMQQWRSYVQDSPKALNYRIYKDEPKFENYFNIVNDRNYITLCRFRTMNHRLPIERGRWQNIPRENRKCNLCQSQDIGDEYHYLLTCTSLREERKLYIKPKLYKRPNTMKFRELMNSQHPPDLYNLCKFIRIINQRLDPPG